MMAKQTFTTGQVLTAAQMTSLQQTAMLGGAANAKVASYVLVAADAGDAITMSNASATTITVNTGLFAAGDIVTIINLGAGVCTITAGTATVTTSGSLALAQNQGGVLRFTSASAAIFFQFATPASGDIEGVTAGTGISGGGTSGTVTITNSMATEITAKGDLIVGTGNAAFDNLPVGTNGYTLVADSSVSPTGLKWAAPASGGMTLISTTSINASSTTISSIPTTYKHLLILGKDIYADVNDTGTGIAVRFNSDTGSNYYMYLLRNIGGTTGGGTDGISSRIDVAERVSSSTTIDKLAEFELWAYRYTDTDTIPIYNRGYGHSGSAGAWLVNTGRYDNSAAITSVTIFNPNSNTLTGTIYVYGVS